MDQTETLLHCNIHGPYDGLTQEVFGVTISTDCPICEAEAKARAYQEAEEAAKKHRETMARLDIERKRRMNLEPRYFNANLDDFVTETPEQKNAKKKIQALLEGSLRKILMTGTHGTGKTMLGSAAVLATNGKIMSMYEISVTIRASYTSLATRTELEIVDELASVPLLVIDEIGRTKGGDAETNWLSYIIDKRHARDLPLILISNNHLRRDCPENDANGKPGCPKCLENYIGEDVTSRLSEGSALVRLNGEDWRRRR